MRAMLPMPMPLTTQGLNVRELATRLKIGRTALYDALREMGQ